MNEWMKLVRNTVELKQNFKSGPVMDMVSLSR